MDDATTRLAPITLGVGAVDGYSGADLTRTVMDAMRWSKNVIPAL